MTCWEGLCRILSLGHLPWSWSGPVVLVYLNRFSSWEAANHNCYPENRSTLSGNNSTLSKINLFKTGAREQEMVPNQASALLIRWFHKQRLMCVSTVRSNTHPTSILSLVKVKTLIENIFFSGIVDSRDVPSFVFLVHVSAIFTFGSGRATTNNQPVSKKQFNSGSKRCMNI